MLVLKLLEISSDLKICEWLEDIHHKEASKLSDKFADYGHPKCGYKMLRK